MEKLTTTALRAVCKERKIKGYSGKTKKELVALLTPLTTVPINETVEVPTQVTQVIAQVIAQVTTQVIAQVTTQVTTQVIPIRQEIIQGDSLVMLPTLESESAQIILCDPPYNIGKDFGNNSDKQTMDAYLVWCESWITECLRILKPNGTMFIYGFSEILAFVLTKVPAHIHRRWIIWHYTNKNVPSLNFWQRSHESILVLWKEGNVFHRDAVREAYTEGFLNGAAGKQRAPTKGRFSKGEQKTTYVAHEGGALPRDVIKLPALAGGAGMKERVDHPTQKPLALCEKLILSCQQPADQGYVLVPFAGSGSECVAAKKIGLPFVGIELNETYVKLTNERLQHIIIEKQTAEDPPLSQFALTPP
jgi:site-specific DNA-methyltransferase (adenine-specific)